MSGQKYTPPTDPKLAHWFAQLDEDAQEYFQERAAVREHLGGLAREQAENLAGTDTRRYLARRDARGR